MAWTLAEMAQLRSLLKQDPEIHSRDLASRLGKTKNEIVGAIHRHDLAWARRRPPGMKQSRASLDERIPRLSAAAKPASPRTPRTPAVIVASVSLPEQRADDVPRVSLAAIADGECRFIPGDPRKHQSGALFCGLPQKPGSRFCPDHHARCYEQARAKGWPAQSRAPAIGAGALNTLRSGGW